MRLVAPTLLVTAVVFAAPTAARADLRDAAARVAEEFKAAGAEVSAAPSRFVHDDETVTVVLPAGDPTTACTHVALIGARGMSFRARLLPFDEDTSDAAARPQGASVAGALVLHTCGGTPPERVLVANEAGRGALEVLVARGRGALPPITAALPERVGGSYAGQGWTEPGELPVLPPPAARADAEETRARRERGVVLARAMAAAGADGVGQAPLMLEAGCHRIELFGVDPRSGRALAPPPRKGSRRARLDLDAELRDEEGELVARDRTEAPDARLDACLGDALAAQVIFAGAPPDSSVIVTHAAWPIPERLPTIWGSETRARMASALLARHASLPADAPVFVAQGPSGTTPVPVPVEPGGCYLAVAAVVSGVPRGIALRVRVGSREVADERGVAGAASAVAFCAEEHGAVRLVVEARGTQLAWGLAVYRVAGGVWGGVK